MSGNKVILKNGLMKTRLLGLLTVLCAATALAQGTIYFRNFNLNCYTPPVYHYQSNVKLSGNQYMVELLASGTSPPYSLISVGTTGFFTGTDAGYFDGGTRTINGIPGGATAFVQLRVWNTDYGATFAAVKENSYAPDSWGESVVWSVTLGDPSASPATPPATLCNFLGTLQLGVPPLSVPPAPTLSIVAAAETMVLSWRDYGNLSMFSNSYTLQSTTNLASDVWSTNSPSPVLTNGQYTITIQATGAERFFRLIENRTPKF